MRKIDSRCVRIPIILAGALQISRDHHVRSLSINQCGEPRLLAFEPLFLVNFKRRDAAGFIERYRRARRFLYSSYQPRSVSLAEAHLQPERIREVDGVPRREAIQVEPAREPDRVFLREPSGRWVVVTIPPVHRSEEHTSELQSRLHLVCRLLLEKKKK